MFSALGVFHVMRYKNVRYLLTYFSSRWTCGRQYTGLVRWLLARFHCYVLLQMFSRQQLDGMSVINVQESLETTVAEFHRKYNKRSWTVLTVSVISANQPQHATASYRSIGLYADVGLRISAIVKTERRASEQALKGEWRGTRQRL